MWSRRVAPSEAAMERLAGANRRAAEAPVLPEGPRRPPDGALLTQNLTISTSALLVPAAGFVLPAQASLALREPWGT